MVISVINKMTKTILLLPQNLEIASGKKTFLLSLKVYWDDGFM